MSGVARVFATLLVVTSLAACRGGQNEAADTWEINGPLLAWDAGIWIIDTVPIVVPDDVTLNDSPILGATVVASGIYDDTGRRVAEEIDITPGAQPTSSLPEVSIMGPIEHIEGHLWVVGGQEVVVPTGSQVRSGEPASDATSLIQIGNVAEVAGNRMDAGRIIARDIVLYPPAGTTQPEPSEQVATEEPVPAPEQPEQSVPDSPTPDEAEPEDGDDEGDGADDDDDNEKKDKPEKPKKPEKPDKPNNDNGRDKKEKP